MPGTKSHSDVLRQESEGEVTQGETEGFDRSDRVLLGEPFREEKIVSVSIVIARPFLLGTAGVNQILFSFRQ
jgi:hypothetical protein